MYQEENLNAFCFPQAGCLTSLFLISFSVFLDSSTFLNLKTQQLVVIRNSWAMLLPPFLLLASLSALSWNSEPVWQQSWPRHTDSFSSKGCLTDSATCSPTIQCLCKLTLPSCCTLLLWTVELFMKGMWSGSLKAFRALVVCLPPLTVCYPFLNLHLCN